MSGLHTERRLVTDDPLEGRKRTVVSVDWNFAYLLILQPTADS